MLVQQRPIGALGRLCCTAEYYRNTREALLVQKSTTGASEAVLIQMSAVEELGSMYWYSVTLS